MGLFVIDIARFVALICCHCGGFVVALRWNYGGLRWWFMVELRWFAVVYGGITVVCSGFLIVFFVVYGGLRWFMVGMQ